MYKEYVVKVKDHDQDTTHTVKQYASSQQEASVSAMKQLRELLGTDNLELV